MLDDWPTNDRLAISMKLFTSEISARENAWGRIGCILRKASLFTAETRDVEASLPHNAALFLFPCFIFILPALLIRYCHSVGSFSDAKAAIPDSLCAAGLQRRCA